MIARENNFYKDEILSDFQARWKASSKEKESAATNTRKRVGMPTIVAKSDAGKYFVEFASSSSFHGFNHLVAPNRHPIETLLAALFIVGALLCLILLSFIFWDRYQNNATVIVVDNNQREFKIAKASLFICPVPNVQLSKIPNVLKKYHVKHTPEAEEFFAFLGNATYDNMMQTPLYDKVSPDKWIEILFDLKRDIPRNLLKENDPYEAWVVTERGFCFATRNRLAAYATLDYWKSNNWTRTGADELTASKLPFYDPSIGNMQEVVAVENTALVAPCYPLEIIRYDTRMRLVQPKRLHRAIMSMSAIITTPNIVELDPEQRKCKFLFDGGLKTWPVYTKNMCMIECRMAVIQKYCNCRPHFARPIEGVSTCNAKQLRCIADITKYLFLYDFRPPFCKCISKCNFVKYKLRDADKAELNDTPINLSIITLIVELPQLVYHRTLLYGFTDFLSSVGGAAGLFLGASVLSFAEICYYATVHWYCYMKRSVRKKRKNKTGSV